MPGDEASGGAGASPGIEDMIAALTGAFKTLGTPRGIPPIKLAKFHGTPSKPGDPTILEWLTEFDEYCRHYKLKEEDKIQALLAHLTGPAKEEVQCQDASVRSRFSSLEQALRNRFAPQETVQALSTQLHARVQQPAESLAEFSSALLRLYDRMEEAASSDERDALKKLRDNTLKERFIRGVRDKLVQRDLRRISVGKPSLTFHCMRREVLELYQDDNIGGSAKVRELQVEAGRVESSTDEVSFGRVKDELAEMRKYPEGSCECHPFYEAGTEFFQTKEDGNVLLQVREERAPQV